MDFLTVPTVTGRVLFVLVLLSHQRRRIVYFNIAEHPTANWAAQQVVEAFPNDTAPRWLLRDRDSIYGDAFRRRVAGMGIAEVICSPASPWQNPYAERVIGSIRRECLDHVIVFGEAHLRRLISAYVAYYHRSRTHLGLGKDTPDGRPSNRQAPDGSSRFPKSVVSITDTSVARRKRHVPSLTVESTPCFAGSTRGSCCTLAAFRVSQEHRVNWACTTTSVPQPSIRSSTAAAPPDSVLANDNLSRRYGAVSLFFARGATARKLRPPEAPETSYGEIKVG